MYWLVILKRIFFFLQEKKEKKKDKNSTVVSSLLGGGEINGEANTDENSGDMSALKLQLPKEDPQAQV